jgi:hypothetical protein
MEILLNGQTQKSSLYDTLIHQIRLLYPQVQLQGIPEPHITILHLELIQMDFRSNTLSTGETDRLQRLGLSILALMQAYLTHGAFLGLMMLRLKPPMSMELPLNGLAQEIL